MYEETLLTDEVEAIVAAHDLSSPLFLLWSMHLVHYPLQVPDAYVAKFASIDDGARRKMAAMASFMDDGIGRVVAALKARPGFWENTLVVLHSDNGGEIIFFDEKKRGQQLSPEGW